MSSTPSNLADLRRRLDAIDDRLQDLLVERAEIVSMVAASKKGRNQPALQPAREAEIIRRIVARHRGPLPVATLVRMWREMLAATVRLQSPFSVAVLVRPERQGCWDLARDHYGSNTPMTTCSSAREVIDNVARGDASAGVLPLPQQGEPDPWWPDLLSTAENTPRVIARLPFGAYGNARSEGVDALAIACGTADHTGFDRTLLAIECAPEFTRARMVELLAALRLACMSFGSCDYQGTSVGLIEIDGFVPGSDNRLNELRAEAGPALHRLMPIGGYAVPLPAAALARRD